MKLLTVYQDAQTFLRGKRVKPPLYFFRFFVPTPAPFREAKRIAYLAGAQYGKTARDPLKGEVVGWFISARFLSSALFWGRVPLLKQTTEKEGTLILTSLLEDLVGASLAPASYVAVKTNGIPFWLVGFLRHPF